MSYIYANLHAPCTMSYTLILACFHIHTQFGIYAHNVSHGFLQFAIYEHNIIVMDFASLGQGARRP